jgi:uncharacterized protein (TIGR00730 family)
MKNVLIFCGANKGNDIAYESAAIEMAKALVKRNINVITGGGSVGVMGVVADAVLAAGGTITGVIPQFLNDLEVGHKGLTEMIVTDTMHERKALMYEKSDGIIALPGGYGTLDELFESLTWAQLDLHRRPIGVLNTKNFYTPLATLLDNMVQEGMLKQKNRELLLMETEPEMLLQQMFDYQPIVESKWL